MKKWVRVLVTTLIGGGVFLIPLVVVTMIIGKALKISAPIARPIAERLPMDTIGGLAVAELLTITMLLLLCFAAGLAARKSFGLGLSKWLDQQLQDFIPRYTVIKAKAQGLIGDSDKSLLKVVLAKFDDNAQIAFEIERAENGLVSLFLPGSPDPWSGTVVHMPAERVVPLDTQFSAVIKSLKAIGSGTTAILDGSNLSKEDVSL